MIRLWANYHLAVNLYEGGKPKDHQDQLTLGIIAYFGPH